jgi:hypothetical protein
MDGKSPVWFKPEVSEQDNGGRVCPAALKDGRDHRHDIDRA